MVVKPGEHVHLAQLLQFMFLGEQLAHDCATAQIALTSQRATQTFLASQRKQEGQHALLFQWAIRWLAPRHTTSPRIQEQMNHYRRLLMAGIARKNFTESVLGEQIILEGLGHAIFQRLEAGLSKRGAPFRKLRQILLHQEQSHHAFGLRTLNRQIEEERISIDSLRNMAPAYMNIGKSMLFSAQDSFHSIQEDPQEYWNDFQRALPVWLQEIPDNAAEEAGELTKKALTRAPGI